MYKMAGMNCFSSLPFFKGLTPLYHACLSGKNPNVAELLLGDQADFGVVDSQGWQEIHQVNEHSCY